MNLTNIKSMDLIKIEELLGEILEIAEIEEIENIMYTVACENDKRAKEALTTKEVVEAEEVVKVKAKVNKGEREMTNPQLLKFLQPVIAKIEADKAEAIENEEEPEEVRYSMDVAYTGEGEEYDLNFTITIDGELVHDMILVGLADEAYCESEAKRTAKYLAKYYPSLEIKF